MASLVPVDHLIYKILLLQHLLHWMLLLLLPPLLLRLLPLLLHVYLSTIATIKRSTVIDGYLYECITLPAIN